MRSSPSLPHYNCTFPNFSEEKKKKHKGGEKGGWEGGSEERIIGRGDKNLPMQRFSWTVSIYPGGPYIVKLLGTVSTIIR